MATDPLAMKILMITSMVPDMDAASAGAIVMHGQLSVLLGSHEVTLATLAWGDPGESKAIDRLRTSGVVVHPIIGRWRGGWRLGPTWLRGELPQRTLQFANPEMQRFLDRLLGGQPFDLLQVEDNAMAAYRYQTDIPRVLTDHEVRPILPAGSSQGMGLARRLWQREEQRRWRRYQRDVWSRFDRVQVFTAGDAAAIRAIAPDLVTRVRINPFGIDVPEAGDPSREGTDTVVFVGGFMHPPNVDAALWLGHEIMPLLRARRPGVRLTIVGGYPPRAVRALADGAVIVTGRVPAVEPFLDEAAVVLAPLRTGGGMRLKVLQAMARGKAVVTTPLGAEGLMVEGTQPPLLVAEDAVGFADTVAAMLTVDDARRALGYSARAFVIRHHTWPAYARRLGAMYAELCPAESPGGQSYPLVPRL